MVSQGFFSGSSDRNKRVTGSSDVKTAGIKGFLQKQVNKQLNKMTKEGKTPFGTPIGGSAVGEEGLGRFGNPERKTSYFSPSGNEVGKVASSDLSNLKIASPEVRIANVRSYTGSDIKPYAPDRVGDYMRDADRDDRSQVEKDRDAIKKFFTREEGGVFKDNDEFDRKMTTYYTDKDGNPAAVNAFGEKVNYDTDTIKRYIATDAKEKYQAQQRTSLDQGLSKLQEMNQRVDDFNYYKRNLDFNEKGEADPANKYVLTAPQMRERMKQLGVNETMDKYGIISAVNPQRYNSFSTEDTRKLGTMPSMGISEAGREQAALNRLQKAKEQGENKNVFQKVGDAVGSVFNKLTGTQAAQAGVNTSATTNLSKINNVNPTVQKARQAVEKSVRRQTGMSSNPGSQRQTGVGKSAGDLSRHKTGRSTSRGGISRSTSRGQGGGPSSRSRGGVSRGGSKSNTGSKSSARGARGSAGSRSRGGTGSGRTSTSRTASKASRRRTGRSRTRCDIRTKINISPLINSNLVKDDLAKLAYFVQEIKK